MRVLHIPTLNPGIAYWRHIVPARALERLGHEVTILDSVKHKAIVDEKKSIGKWIAAKEPKFDLIHTGYTPRTEHIEMLFKLRQDHGIPFITDIDDDMDAVEPYNPGYAMYRKGTTHNRIVKMQLKISDAVSLTTQPLATSIGYLNECHAVLPNCINPNDWANLPRDPLRNEDGGIRLMFTGGYGRYGDWNVVREPVERLMAHYPKLRLFFMGGTPDWVAQWMPSHVDPSANRAFYIQPTMAVPVFQSTLAWIAPDIIASPVLANKFNSSKSSIKAMEAAMAGAAFACTDWPTYGDVPKGTCLKCDNTNVQWEESLSALIEDSELRKRLATSAKEWVLDSCVIDKYIKDGWLRLYEEVCAAGPLKAQEVAQQGA